VDLTQFGLFDLAERRLRWADKRQEVLAQNIANANTPSYQPRDLPSFAGLIRNAPIAVLARTDPGHLSGTLGGQLQDAVLQPAVRSPDRNGVAIESELSKVADTETTQELVTNVYRKYMSLFRVALGRSQ
jgi:flagellar basal-body rod protein FlgB